MSANTAAAKLAGLNQKLDQLQLKYAGLEKHVNKGGANKKKSGGAVPAEEEVTEFKAAFLTQLTEVQKHLAAEHAMFATAEEKKNVLIKDQAKLQKEITQALADLERAEENQIAGSSLEETVVIPPEVKVTHSAYSTYDDDSCHGQSIPASWEALYDKKCHLWLTTKGSSPIKLQKNKPVIFLFWAQYHKPGHKFLRLYHQLRAKLNGKLDLVGISTDPQRKFAEDFDYVTNKCSFPQAFDEGGGMKEAASVLTRASLSIPHMFLVSRGTIVWHQNHSQIGTTAHTWMELVERQAALLLNDKPLQRVGTAPRTTVAEEDDMPVPDDDFSLF